MKTILTIVPLWRLSIGFVTVIALLAIFFSVHTVEAESYPAISSQVNIGERSANVSNLQTFLAANPSIYPEGLVTGYYGPLTVAAVTRFQNLFGIDPVGRVGPLTLTKINAIIAGGGWSSTSADVSGPWIYSVGNSLSQNAATFTWYTNELASGKIFYYTSPITMNEGDINSIGFGAKNGWVAVNDGLARNSQQVTVTGLQPNTTYYYVIVSTDLSGNVSVWNPNATFRTN